MKSLGLLLIALFFVIALVPPFFILRLIRDALTTRSVSIYLKTCALGLDQFGSSVLYVEEDFTVSAMTYKKASEGKKAAYYFMLLIDFLSRLVGDVPRHCERAYQKEIKKFRSF